MLENIDGLGILSCADFDLTLEIRLVGEKRASQCVVTQEGIDQEVLRVD